MTNTLMPYWLRSGDRGYMGVPLEVRAPFLDYRVIEFAFRLPLTYLIRDGWHKWILRKTVEDLLPADVVWRRRKLGFPFPYERFFSASEPIIELIREHSQNPYVDLSKPAEFCSDWNKISFVLWYELFFNENVPLFEKIEAKARRNLPLETGEYRPRFLTCSNSMR
jgi:asparagine synthase (glutamine-hydrolysing)